MVSRANNPFRFVTQLSLVSLTGAYARDLKELVTVLKSAPLAVVYYHTHHFLKQHHYLSPEPPNDFAWWITNVLQEKTLGEQLLSIDTVQYTSLRALAENIIKVIENHLARYPVPRTAPPGEELYFMKSQSFFIPTPFVAYTLEEFLAALQKVSIFSLYHHMFEARIRLEKGANDFSNWLAQELGEKDLARAVARFDPYTQTLDDLRKKIIGLIQKRLKSEKEKEAVHAA